MSGTVPRRSQRLMEKQGVRSEGGKLTSRMQVKEVVQFKNKNRRHREEDAVKKSQNENIIQDLRPRVSEERNKSENSIAARSKKERRIQDLQLELEMKKQELEIKRLELEIKRTKELSESEIAYEVTVAGSESEAIQSRYAVGKKNRYQVQESVDNIVENTFDEAEDKSKYDIISSCNISYSQGESKVSNLSVDRDNHRSFDIQSSDEEDNRSEKVSSVSRNKIRNRERNNFNTFMARQSVNKDLPTFSGEPSEWLNFKTQFKETTELCKFSKRENMDRLKKCLKGKAKESVQALLNFTLEVGR